MNTGASTSSLASESCARHGYIQVYTGWGKGKTTAALGLAVRAAGHGHRVYIGQFLKGRECGEHRELAGHPLITLEQFGCEDFFLGSSASRRHAHEAGVAKAFARCSQAVMLEDYDLVVLDEIDVASAAGLLSIDEVLALIDARPECVEMVLTGRDAPACLLDRADLVTEMREVKHYYRAGVGSRPGIEY
ncbi:MAG: cob(I)yrinic acid a,c-diamide adenosyltransferase [Thermoleophilia bacterium]